MNARVIKWEARTAGGGETENASGNRGDERDPGAASVGDATGRREHRPLLDASSRNGFVAYPFYTVREVASILGLSDDFVRALFRGGRQGRVIEISNRRPGRRTYRTLLIPHETLTEFLVRSTREALLTKRAG